jgi:UDP-sulfoquinovose synthase
MKVLITGIDGYSGWPLALHLLKRGHDVVGIDNLVTRKRVKEVGSWSATPIPSFPNRQKAVKEILGKDLGFYKGDLTDWEFTRHVLELERPDSIVHLAEQRSAPYSMIDVHHAVATQIENLTGTLHLLYAIRECCPETHLVKMGTMGEYGTPNTDIPEGFFDVEFRGRKDHLPFPRSAGSWYHWSKVFDSGDVMFATKIWNLKSTDVMQGVIYGTRTADITDDRLLTRFDFDETWGTALNRFIAQAVVGLPITPYGKGDQKRGFLALEDSMQSLTIAVENPPSAGEYRVFNQFDAAYSINELADITHKVATELGLNPTIEHPVDPRVELEQHYYNPLHDNLIALGYKRTRQLEDVMREIFADLLRYRRRLEARKYVIQPTVQWRIPDSRPAIAARVTTPAPPTATEGTSLPASARPTA